MSDWTTHRDRMRDAYAPAAPAPKQVDSPWKLNIERMKARAARYNKTLRDELEDSYAHYRESVNLGYCENDQSVHDQYKAAIKGAKEDA